MTATFSIEKGEMGGKSSHSKVSRPGRTRLHASMWACGGVALVSAQALMNRRGYRTGAPLAVAARARRRVGARGGEVTVSGGRKAALGQARGAGLG